MKHAKKLASLLLAMLMAFAMATTAFAAGHTYEIYQIFTGDYHNGILSNVKWGQNGTGTKGEAVADEIIEELEKVAKATSDTAKLAVINKYANLSSAAYKTGSATTYEGLPNGYYLVKDEDNTVTGNDFYTLYIVQVVNGTLTFSPKGDVPKTEKKIVEGEERVDVNEASIGDTVSYEITGTMPTNIDQYNTFYYEFTDTLSAGLTYKSDITVKIGDQDVTKYFYKNADTAADTGITTITVSIQDLLALEKLGTVEINKDTVVTVTYSAILNEKAVIADAGNPNDVSLKYSNDPNNSGEGSTTPPSENPEKPSPTHPTGATPKDEVVTYTTELSILKNDEQNAILPGAEFTLTGNGVNVVLVTTEKFTEDTNGDYWKLKDGTYTKTQPIIGGEADNSADYDNTTTKYSKTTELVAKGNGKTETSVVGAVDSETGTVTFTGLGAGTYTIKETKTPDGYNTIAPVTFTLTFNAGTKTFVVSDNEKIVVGADNKLDTTIINKAGATLPSTGGMGTTLLYVIGSVLVVGAAVLLIVKKRMGAEK
ncbi:MAG: isopeptide-forming domain-containing fimbrial protein [Candidatus Heritagella sp.]|nr:isopeptide-forming domain-containing fimbrial protein [Candidatus Heritagella sp.]